MKESAAEARPSRQQWQNATREAWKLDWSKRAVRGALHCVPGLAIPLAVGLFFGSPAAGVVAASGALTTGFGSFHRLLHSCMAPMLLASVGIAISAFAGTLAGQSDIGFTIVAGLWAFGCGVFAAIGADANWIGLQCAIYALIASHYPRGFEPALSRASLVLAGGLLQTVLSVLFSRIDRTPCESPSSAEKGNVEIPTGFFAALPRAIRKMLANLTPRTQVGHDAWRLALATSVAAAASRSLHLENGYWVPMTVLIVLKADLLQTVTRGLARAGGTLLGVGVATVVVATVKPGPLELACLVLAFAFLCYALLNVNYGIFAVCLTSLVVFELAMVGLPEMQIATARLLNTVVGGSIALAAHVLWPSCQQMRSEG